MWLSNIQYRLARINRRPEFRVAALLCLVWMFLVQAYQPWRYSSGYKSPRILEEATLFFWRIGFNALQNSVLALAVGLASIVLLVYVLAWVVRSFGRRDEEATPPARSSVSPGVSTKGKRKADPSELDALKHDNTAGGLDGFLKLCHAIRLNCWQQIQGDDRHQEANLTTLKAAYRDYRLQVSPWLPIILDMYRDETEIVMQARNSAAKCLSSLAGGFMCLNHVNEAERLASEALALVLDDPALESETELLLKQIRTERQQAPQPPPDHSASGGPEPRQAAGTPEQGELSSRGFGRHKIWLLGIAILGLIPLVIKTVDLVSSPADLHPRRVTPVESNRAEAGPLVPSTVKDALGAASQGQQTEQPVLTAVAVPAPPAVREIVATGVSIPAVQVKIDPSHSNSPEPCRVAVSDHEQHRPANAHEFDTEDRGNGLGRLTVTNGNSEDAAVLVSNLVADTEDRLVYVRAGMTAIIERIAPGEYGLKFQIGNDWDDVAEDFRCVTATAEFDRSASFQEEQTEGGIQYSVVNITLHKLVGGNARTTPINPAAFRRRRKHG